MIKEIIKKIENKNISILGFGKEGKSTYNFIRKYLNNQKITIIDKNNVQNDEILKNDNNINIIYGDNYLDNLEIYDLVIKTPGITLKDINTTNINITSELELFLEINNKNVIGVTGTKGKSTTSSLIYNIIKNQNSNCILAGNIGIPLFDCLENVNENTICVLEMSSHQLEFVKCSPHIGIILNLFIDHLDHAVTIEHYHNSKLNMFKYQNNNDISIYCSSNETLDTLVKNNNYQSNMYTVNLNDKADVYKKDNFIYYKDKKLYNINDTRNLIGNHNLENIMVSLIVSELLNLDIDKTIEVINNFKPLEYRLENVGVINNITYYMSTLSTIPEATINDIEALENVNTLIFGGMDRGIPYDKLINYLNKSNIEHFICMPTTGHNIAKYLPKEKVFLVDTLSDAVDIAKQVTKKESICLLSPAASSYEQFKNYQEKGDKFKELINE